MYFYLDYSGMILTSKSLVPFAKSFSFFLTGFVLVNNFPFLDYTFYSPFHTLIHRLQCNLDLSFN